MGRHRDEWPAVILHDIREYFRPPAGPVFKGFDAWYGADVVLATGWDTVYAVLGLEHCRARAYLVQDHEPEFFATSAESVFAERTYGQGLHCITASPWLRDLVAAYGAHASAFRLGVDQDVYRLGRSNVGATRSSSMREPSRRDAPCRWGCSRSRS